MVLLSNREEDEKLEATVFKTSARPYKNLMTKIFTCYTRTLQWLFACSKFSLKTWNPYFARVTWDRKRGGRELGYASQFNRDLSDTTDLVKSLDSVRELHFRLSKAIFCFIMLHVSLIDSLECLQTLCYFSFFTQPSRNSNFVILSSIMERILRI